MLISVSKQRQLLTAVFGRRLGQGFPAPREKAQAWLETKHSARLHRTPWAAERFVARVDASE